MRFSAASVLFGVATVSIVAQAPAQAAEFYTIQSGVTSLSVEPSVLTALSSVGLTFSGAFDTVAPASGFGLGFSIVPPSSDPAVLGSSFLFSYDQPTNTFGNFSGTIEHSGGLRFAVDESRLSLLSPLELGNFAIGFDDGFKLSDNLTVGGLVLFDLIPTAAPTLNGSNFAVTTSVRVSSAFNDLLTNSAGTDLGLTGTVIGTAQINAQAVPEPATMLGLMAGGAFLAANRRRKSSR
jgi:hypothetical protein